MVDDHSLFGGMSPAAFLADHWQKRPLLVRGAVADSGAFPRLDDLVELAAQKHPPSRLVVAPRGDSGWSVRPGPFDAAALAELPADGWTLLVQEVDRYLPSCAALLERFRFAPNWRLDDVMVSHAADGGGVGAHLDRYDVFLVQTCGRRRWRIETTPRVDVALDPKSPLPLLARFRADAEWVLEPGDLLYLPPRVAHEGVALGPCVTCSVGFRVPDPRELCAGFLRQLEPEAFESIRYADPGLRPAERAGEIGEEARSALREAARSLFSDGPEFDLWLGRLMTTPLRGVAAGDAAQRAAMAARLWEHVAGGGGLERSAPAHFAWFREGDGAVQLFAGGEHYPLGRDREAPAELLCGRRPLDAGAVGELADDERLAGILIDLLRRGLLTLAEGPETA